jgi:hypothetical protein
LRESGRSINFSSRYFFSLRANEERARLLSGALFDVKLPSF